MNRIWLTAAVALLAIAPRQASAENDALAPEVPSVLYAPFTLILNHVDKGEMIIVLKDGDVFVKRADLESAGLKLPRGKDVVIGGQSMLSLKAASPPLHYTLDENEIMLRIVAPASLLPTTTIDLDPHPPKIIYRDDTSAFFNYAAHANDRGQLDFYDEVGVSVDKKLLFSSMYMSREHEPVRGLTNFTIDDRQARRRLVFGDALVSTGPLGAGGFIGGATFSRAYELDPYVVRTPAIGYAGTTLTPATIDVYVNDARVRSEQVQPGSFELENLRVGGGSGVAKYVIRDVFGHEETVEAPFYVSNVVLAKGLDEYTYAFGALRDAVGRESWHYGAPAFMGRHRIGVSNSITLGGRLEARDETLSAGPSITTLTPIGQFELEVGASRSPGDTVGLASSLAYTYASRRFGGGVLGRLVTDRYATVRTSPQDDRTTHEAGIFSSVPIGSAVSVSAQASVSKSRDRRMGARVNGHVSTRLTRALNLVVGAGQSKSPDGSTPWNVFASLSMVLPERHGASLSGHLEQSGPSLELSAGRSQAIGEGYGYRGAVRVAERSSADAFAQYQSQVGRYGASYRLDDGGHHLSLETAGGLAIIPGVGLFPTLPVQDGFGVIRIEGVGNVRGYVNNQDLGRTDRNGNLLVPNLISYYGNRLSVEPEDIPMRYNLQMTDMTLAPPYRGAAIANFPVTIPHYCRGRVAIDDRGVRIVPKYGELRIQRAKDEFISPIGAAGEFELEGIESGHHAIVVDYAEGTCEMVLNVVSSSDTIIDLGEVVCKTR